MSVDYTSARPPLVERAYELARSGSCRCVSEIHALLTSEGYHLSAYFDRPSLSRDLLRVCREARDERPPRISVKDAVRQWFMAAFQVDAGLGDGQEQRWANQG